MAKTKSKDPLKVLKKKVKACEAFAAEKIEEVTENLRVFQRKLRKLTKQSKTMAEELDHLKQELQAVRKVAVKEREKRKAEVAALTEEVNRLQSLIHGPVTTKIRSIEKRVGECEVRERDVQAQVATHSRTIRNYAEMNAEA